MSLSFIVLFVWFYMDLRKRERMDAFKAAELKRQREQTMEHERLKRVVRKQFTQTKPKPAIMSRRELYGNPMVKRPAPYPAVRQQEDAADDLGNVMLGAAIGELIIPVVTNDERVHDDRPSVFVSGDGGDYGGGGATSSWDSSSSCDTSSSDSSSSYSSD